MELYICVCLALAMVGVSAGETKKTQTEVTLADPNPQNDTILDVIQQMKSTIQELKENLTRVQFSRRSDVQHASFLAVMVVANQEVLPRGIVHFPVIRHSVAPPNFGYDEKISFFRCPENGTYVFATSLNVYGENLYHIYSIMKEGTVLASTRTYTTRGNGYRACSITVTTPCKKGEDVWVANTQTATRTVYSDSDGLSHFTGYRLY